MATKKSNTNICEPSISSHGGSNDPTSGAVNSGDVAVTTAPDSEVTSPATALNDVTVNTTNSDSTKLAAIFEEFAKVLMTLSDVNNPAIVTALQGIVDKFSHSPPSTDFPDVETVSANEIEPVTVASANKPRPTAVPASAVTTASDLLGNRSNTGLNHQSPDLPVPVVKSSDEDLNFVMSIDYLDNRYNDNLSTDRKAVDSATHILKLHCDYHKCYVNCGSILYKYDTDISVLEMMDRRDMIYKANMLKLNSANTVREAANVVMKFFTVLDQCGNRYLISPDFLASLTDKPISLAGRMDIKMFMKNLLISNPHIKIPEQESSHAFIEIILSEFLFCLDQLFPVEDFMRYVEQNYKQLFDCGKILSAYIIIWTWRKASGVRSSFSSNDYFDMTIINTLQNKKLSTKIKKLLKGRDLMVLIPILANNINLSNLYEENHHATTPDSIEFSLRRTCSYVLEDEQHINVIPSFNNNFDTKNSIIGTGKDVEISKRQNRKTFNKKFNRYSPKVVKNNENKNTTVLGNRNTSISQNKSNDSKKKRFGKYKQQPSINTAYLIPLYDEETDDDDGTIRDGFFCNELKASSDSAPKGAFLYDTGATNSCVFTDTIGVYDSTPKHCRIQFGPNLVECNAIGKYDIFINKQKITIPVLIIERYDGTQLGGIISVNDLIKQGVEINIGKKFVLTYKNESTSVTNHTNNLAYYIPSPQNWFSDVGKTNENIHGISLKPKKRSSGKRFRKHDITIHNLNPLSGNMNSGPIFDKLQDYFVTNSQYQKIDPHKSFNHLSDHRILQTLKNIKHCKYVKFSIPKKLIQNMRRHCDSSKRCVCCVMSRNKLSGRTPKTNFISNNVTVPLSMIHMDVYSIANMKFLTFADPVSKMTFMREIDPSSNASNLIIEFFNQMQSIGCNITAFVTDNDKRFETSVLKTFYKGHGINHINSIAYQPKSNAFIERQQQTIFNMVRAAIIYYSIPVKCIPRIVDHCCFMYNISYHPLLKTSPFETAAIPVNVFLEDLTPLGSPVLYKPFMKVKGDKIYDYMLHRGMFLGRSMDTTSGFYVLNYLTKDIVLVNSFVSLTNSNDQEPESSHIAKNLAVINTASCMSVKKEVMSIPLYSDMKQSDIWVTAILKELNNLSQRGVFKETTSSREELLKDDNNMFVPTKWVMTWKGGLPKCRLVLRGDYLTDHYEDKDKYSPTINLESVKTMLVTLIRHGYYFTIADVKQAFTLGETKNYGINVYTTLPAFYELLSGKEEYNTSTNKNGSRRVFLNLVKNLYGHPLAGIVFYHHFISKLKLFGFEVYSNSSCILYSKCLEMFILIYVDDVILFDKKQDNKARLQLIKDLSKTDIPLAISLENSSDTCEFKFIGLNCKIDGSTISFCLEVNVDKFFSLLEIKKTSLYKRGPYFTRMSITEANEEYAGTVSLKSVQSFVGYMTYVVQARPEIAFIVNYLQSYQSKYNKHYLKIAGILVNYLFHNPKVVFCYNYKNSANEIKVFVDSDHGGNHDRYSNGCYFVFVFGVLVLSKTKLNRCISMSSTYSELYTINRNIDTITGVIQLVHDTVNIIKSELPKPRIFMDNAAAIKIVENNIRYTTKFKDIHIQNLRKTLRVNGISLEHIVSEENLADIGTKSLNYDKFQELCFSIGAQFK